MLPQSFSTHTHLLVKVCVGGQENRCQSHTHTERVLIHAASVSWTSCSVELAWHTALIQA